MTRLLLTAAAFVLTACATGPGPGPEPVRQELLAPSLGVDLSAMERTESGLYVETLRPGDGRTAERGQQVLVHYEGFFADGRRFDSSRDRHEPLEIPIGMDVVIDAWDEGIVGMRVGELRRLVVPPELGYGDRGAPGIPPDATLVFEIELLGVR
ncbi:MAG: FKBP-type peptidyl-prolyl cis-trans isomerase [Gemmatimonadota bacterium]